MKCIMCEVNSEEQMVCRKCHSFLSWKYGSGDAFANLKKIRKTTRVVENEMV